MQLSKILNEILGSSVKVRVLRCLALGCDGKTGRELARIAKISSPAILKPLHDLENQGIVTKKIAGKSYCYYLNRNNIIVSEGIIPLFQLETNLSEKLGSLLQESFSNKIVSAVWYGSTAKGSAGPQSDWDILLLCADVSVKQEILEKLAANIIEWSKLFSSHLDIKAMAVDEFRNKFLKGDAFARNVYNDYLNSQITNPIYGEPLTMILGGHSDQKNSDKNRG